MTKCPRCHEEQPDGTKFCMSCGARLTYETKRPTAPVDPATAFAPTLASEIPTKPGTATPGSVPVVAAPGATATPGPQKAILPPSVGTTPPPFATPMGVVITPAAAPAAGAPASASMRVPAPSTTPPRGGPAAPSPVIGTTEDKSILVAAVSGKLVGLDVQTGAVVWEHAIDNGTPQLLIGQGLVLAAVGQSLYCCEYRTGRPMWRAALSAYAPRITMILEGDQIYAFGAGVVDAFDRIGRRLWTRPILPGAPASGAIGVPGNVSQADRD